MPGSRRFRRGLRRRLRPILKRLLDPALMSELVGRANAHDRLELVESIGSAGSEIHLRMPVVIYAPEKLVLGDRVAVGEYSVLRANGGITIGSRVLLAAHVVVTSRGHPETPPRWGNPVDEPVVIEDDVWIGAGAVILPGVTIGRGSIVGAGSVVTSSVDPDTIVGGVPARPIRPIRKASEAGTGEAG